MNQIKQCFSCKKDLEVRKFKSIDAKVYQQKSWLGCAICCRNCNIKRELKNGLVRRIDGKFQVMEWCKTKIILDNLK
jgi:hypothetical protein